MSIRDQPEFDSNSPSEVDWIVCFAIIKKKNPIIWENLDYKCESHSAHDRSNTIYSLIPEYLPQLRVNQPLLMQLNIVYQYILGYKSLVNNLEILKTLSDDITANEITRWVLPNYKCIATLLSLEGQIGKSLNKLYVCFQLLISSYCCFQLRDFTKFIMDTLITKLINRDILANKTKNSRIVQQHLSNEKKTVDRSQILKFHCKTITMIMNLKVKILASSISDERNTDAMQFFHLVGELCFYIESLAHALIAQLSNNDSRQIDKQLAFSQHYLDRTKSLARQQVEDVLLTMIENIDRPQEKVRSLKMIIKQLLRVLNGVDWIQLNDYVARNQVHIKTMLKRRMNIQATLLVAGDLDLISEFRFINWPAWAVNN